MCCCIVEIEIKIDTESVDAEKVGTRASDACKKIMSVDFFVLFCCSHE